MNEDLLLKKIESLNRCVDRLEKKKPATLDILLSDFDVQDIITINLERAVQLCVDIALIVLSDRGTPTPSTMAEGFDLLTKPPGISPETARKMKSAVGFRNVAVHAYKQINWSIVWSILQQHLQDFHAYAREVLALTSKG